MLRDTSVSSDPNLFDLTFKKYYVPVELYEYTSKVCLKLKNGFSMSSIMGTEVMWV